MILKHRKEGYNTRRFSKPWLARIESVSATGAIKLQFAEGDTAEAVFFNAEPGEVFAFGQRDYRGNKGGTWWIVLNNSDSSSVFDQQFVSRAEAIEKWFSRQV